MGCKLHVFLPNKLLIDNNFRRFELPVDGDVFVSSVSDIDDEGVAIVNFQSWARELPIHRDGVVGVAQPLHFGCLNLFSPKKLIRNGRKITKS